MGFVQEIQQDILKYLHEVYPKQYKDFTIADVAKQPYHKQVWVWWTSKAYYKINNSYLKLEDAPPDAPEGTWISIMSDACNQYQKRDGKWYLAQTITQDEVKKIFGVDVPG